MINPLFVDDGFRARSFLEKGLLRYLKNLKPGSEPVAGNFCSSGADFNYIALLNRVLHHCITGKLVRLVTECGTAHDQAGIGRE